MTATSVGGTRDQVTRVDRKPLFIDGRDGLETTRARIWRVRPSIGPVRGSFVPGTELLSACRDASTRSARSTPTRGFSEVYARPVTPRKREVSNG